MRRGTIAAIILLLLGLIPAGLSLRYSNAFPLSGDQTVLPPGTDLNEETLDKPREVFRSEAIGGAKSYTVNLGDLAFNSNLILGRSARRAGMSCGTCHVNGAGNGKLFVPGMSTRPGNFDTTGPLFNPKAHNLARDPVRIPSLRGARYLAPYGNDGRIASLREFVRNVIVNEFAGPEPSPAILDAIVAYIEDIDFLPNLNLAAGGRLGVRAADDAQRRGEALFFKPFPHNPELSCAGCHIPSSVVRRSHRQHNVGSGGVFKTPTLMNANFNAPYFHDGRFDTYDQVIDHFDRTFELGLSLRIAPISSPISRRSATGCSRTSATASAQRSRKSTISPACSAPRFRPMTTTSSHSRCTPSAASCAISSSSFPASRIPRWRAGSMSVSPRGGN